MQSEEDVIHRPRNHRAHVYEGPLNPGAESKDYFALKKCDGTFVPAVSVVSSQWQNRREPNTCV